MVDIAVSCDTIVRLTKVLQGVPNEADPIFRCLRLDNGVIIATDRRFMAVEKIADFTGIFHVFIEPALLKQCETEAGFNGMVTFTITPELGYGVAKTTLGYIHPNNTVYMRTDSTDFDRWREIVKSIKEPANKSLGGMMWDADSVARLAASSPSGRVVFEEKIDTNRPTLIRDINDYGWIGVFNPFTSEQSYQPAILPSWVVV